jgi:CRISPR system Cascade subunit CasE
LNPLVKNQFPDMSLILTRALVPYDLAARWIANGRPGFADPYAWHQRAWECFPDASKDADRNFLTRIDPKDQDLQLLILSPSVPVRPEWCPLDQWQSKTVDGEFLSQSRYRFSLLANPTRKVRSNTKGEILKNSRRVPITHREDRTDPATGRVQRGLVSWMREHGESAGFFIDEKSLQTITTPCQTFSKQNGGRHHGALHAVDFQGTLTVEDSEKLRAAFTTGIGSAKAFGFGMLCLSPL